MGVEFVLQVLALAGGPVSLVQLLVVMELPFCLILSRLVLGGRLGVREWSATSAMTLGVITLLLFLSPRGGDPDAVGPFAWLAGLAVTVGTIVVVLLAGRRAGRGARTVLAGTAAGMTAGLVAVLIKPVTSAVGRGVGGVFATWQFWAVLVVAAAAFLLLRNALRAGRLVASQPGITLANPLVAAVWGVVIFHEQVRTGWLLLGAGVGAALLAGGAVLLSGSPLLADDLEQRADERVSVLAGQVAFHPLDLRV
jgi:drug/metabolite transporter (DMT)-like permease